MSREVANRKQSSRLRNLIPRRRRRRAARAFPPPRSVGSFIPTVNRPPSIAIDDNSAKSASYYLGNPHHLIQRHTESMIINADQTACWRLKIDFALPKEREAQCERHNDEAFFLFPLLYLRKAEGRTGFEAKDEKGTVISLPNRGTSDRVSAVAAAHAAVRILDRARREGQPSLPMLPLESLVVVFNGIASLRAYEASVILNHLLNKLDPEVKRAWKDAGLIEDLKMLVDHSLVWIPLRGLPGERRAIEVGHDTGLLRRPLLRWHFGELREPRFRLVRRRRAKQLGDPGQFLDTGDGKYGRAARRISLSVLGERLAKPLGWMPIEFDFPTIYTRRCGSYHFELTCPKGLSPRGLRLAVEGNNESARQVTGRATTERRAAHLYLPGRRALGDVSVMLRVTVGISPDAFPVLWLMMGAVTVVLLWALVGFNPEWLVAGDTKNHNEIAAGILLIVPASLGAVAVGTEESTLSSLISGARILVLIIGLCCAASAAVLVNLHPFSSKPQATWAVCAAIATAAMIPLATSWLQSLPSVLRILGMLRTAALQYDALFVQAALVGLIWIVMRRVEGTALGAMLAGCLLFLAVTLTLLASNRMPMPIEASRSFVSVGAVMVAFVALTIACIELQAIFAPYGKWREAVRAVEIWVLIVAPLAGLVLGLVTSVFGPRQDEVSVSPGVGAALVRGERIRELQQLRKLEEKEEE